MPDVPFRIARDHAARRVLAEGPAPLVRQFRCEVCGVWFLLAASFERHRAAEALTLAPRAAAQQSDWEGRRRAWSRVHGYPTAEGARFG